MTTSTRGLMALGRIEDAWAYLDDALEGQLVKPPGPTRTSARQMSDRTRGALDELLRVEREERQRPGAVVVPLRTTRAPARVGVLDAAALVVAAVETAAWQAKSELRIAAPLPVLGGARARESHRLVAGVDVLVIALPMLAPLTLATIVPPLERAARRLVDVVDIGDEFVPVPADCEVCDERTLEASLSWPDERTHVVRCASCTCTGEPCPCGRPGRAAGDEHVWPLRDLYERRPWPIKTARRLERRRTAAADRARAAS